MVAGPDFISFQVRDLDRSAAFYEGVLGMNRLPVPNPDAVVFTSEANSFAVRRPFPGVDLDTVGQLGAGIGVWFHEEDAIGLHARLQEHGAPIVQEPFESPFGTTFSFRDPDGYVVTVHSKA